MSVRPWVRGSVSVKEKRGLGVSDLVLSITHFHSAQECLIFPSVYLLLTLLRFFPPQSNDSALTDIITKVETDGATVLNLAME